MFELRAYGEPTAIAAVSEGLGSVLCLA